VSAVFAALLVLAGSPRPKVHSAHRDPGQMAAALKAAHSADPKARAQGYLTLSKQGVEKRVPDPEPNEAAKCTELKSEGACATTVFACNRIVQIDAEETHYESLDRQIGFGLTESAAKEQIAEHLMARQRKTGLQTTDMQCVVVFVDGCDKRVALVCTTANETAGKGADGPPKTEAVEVSLN
jgi:hypothetical protein